MKGIAVIILGLNVGLIAFLTVRTIVYPWRRQIEAGTATRCSHLDPARSGLSQNLWNDLTFVSPARIFATLSSETS